MRRRLILRNHPRPVLRREGPTHRLRRRIHQPHRRRVGTPLRHRGLNAAAHRNLLSRPTRCTRTYRMSHVSLTGREPVTPEYLAFVREHTGPDLPIHAYNVAGVDADPDRARRAVRTGLSWIGDPDWAPHIQALPFAAEFADLRRNHPRRADFAAALPDEWVDQLAVTGTPADARGRLARLDDAGSCHAVLIPAGP